MTDEGFVECKRCSARTDDTVPHHYCRACARFLEGQSEARHKLDSATKVTNQILRSIAMIVAANKQPSLTRWFTNTLAEQAILLTLEQNTNKLTKDELVYFNRLVQYVSQAISEYETRLSTMKITGLKPTPPVLQPEAIFNPLEAEEPILDQPNQQSWDWNPDDEQDWTDDYEPPPW